MCECGCSDFNAKYKLKGPDGSWYSISIYPGCKDCDTPAGVQIGRHSPESAEAWGVTEVPDAPFLKMNGEDYDGQEVCLPIFHPSALVRELGKLLEPVKQKLARSKSKEADVLYDMLPGDDVIEELLWEHGQRVREKGE